MQPKPSAETVSPPAESVRENIGVVTGFRSPNVPGLCNLPALHPFRAGERVMNDGESRNADLYLRISICPGRRPAGQQIQKTPRRGSESHARGGLGPRSPLLRRRTV